MSVTPSTPAAGPLQIDAALEPWPVVSAECGAWDALLLGNGASCAVWKRFTYGSLYERAASGDLDDGLTAEDIELFTRFNTVNFEAVLSALATTAQVIAVLNLPDEDPRLVQEAILERYRSVQAALAAAVHDRHIAHGAVPQNTLLTLRAEMRHYRTVFSTNYDLLVYWAVMAGGPAGFTDLFFNGETFDPDDAEVSGVWRTVVLWLHGALHLQRRVNGETRKRASGEIGEFNDILSQFKEPTPGLIPLVITEGTSRQKLAAIERSEYLAHAYEQLSGRRASAVVFGHSLGEMDEHLVSAIRGWGLATIAVSVWPGMGPEAIIELKVSLRRRLPDARLLYFDSTTHPLGNPALQVADP
jgi:hypothetical protein